jgi:glycogen operon protein
VWNLPPFNPLELARQNYQPFAEVLRANMRHAGVLRIDHVLGLARQFWVPRGESGADGAYVSMPVNKLMSVVAAESQRAKCVVIGEDLGTVPEGFRDKLWAANMLSYRVLWFEQNEQDYAPPESYPRQAIVCLSSHDLLPFRGWEKAIPPDEREKLARAVTGTTSNTGDLLADAHEFVARTPCSIMLVQADDLSGETEPLNVPGTDKERPNWRRRLSLDSAALADLPATRAVLVALRKGGRLQ